MANEKKEKVKNDKPFYKRTWFIVLAVIVVFGAIGSIFGEGEPAVEENPPAETQTEAEQPPAPKDEAEIAKYKEAVHDPYMRGVDRYDELASELVNITSMMEAGSMDIYTGYTEIQNIESEYKRLAEVFYNLFEISSFTEEDKDNFENGKSSLEAGARLMGDVAGKLAKAIDKGDLSPSNMEKIANLIQSAETEMSVGMSHMVDLDHSYGITIEDLQQ